MTITVAIADDQALIRAGFRVLIESESDLEVVGEAGDGQTAVELARRTQPEVMLMDVRMPGLDGIQATRQITGSGELSIVRILILTTFDLDEYVYDALRAGASGFLLKDTDPPNLLQAIRVIAAGDALIEPRVTRRLISEFAARSNRMQHSGVLLDVLTDREREVLVQVAAGLSNDEIADTLFISPATAKTHVSRIMQKLDARDRAQLVMLAYETGLVTPAS